MWRFVGGKSPNSFTNQTEQENYGKVEMKCELEVSGSMQTFLEVVVILKGANKFKISTWYRFNANKSKTNVLGLICIMIIIKFIHNIVVDNCDLVIMGMLN